MALVRGASSFWLKETVSTVGICLSWADPDGSNEAFLLTTHLLKYPTTTKFKWEYGCVPSAISPTTVISSEAYNI